MKNNISIVLIIVLTFFLQGVGQRSYWHISLTDNEPPDLSISIDNKEIDYVSAKNKWMAVFMTERYFVTIFKEQKDIPFLKRQHCWNYI